MTKATSIRFSQAAAILLAQAAGISLGVLGYTTLLSVPGMAQINPDTSLNRSLTDPALPNESSVVNLSGVVNGEPAILIEGGAARESNLFHSFTDFNVGANQRVYFANPIDVENILSRITGNNSISNINGLLGVEGDANLFLLNPNGVIFGPNAELDISGAFSVSTADSLSFQDGSEFRTMPQVNELFTASVPLGVQFNEASPPQGDISSQGDLIFSGEAITLLGQNITVGSIDTFGSDGDPISLEVTGDINLGDLDSTGGDGGAISLIAAEDLTTGDLTSFGGNGGAISLTTTGDLTTGDLDSFGGDGGTISLEAAGDLITGDLDSIGGDGGTISLEGVGNVITGDLDSTSRANNGDAGDGGDISITATGGYVDTGYLESSSRANNDDAGDGGDISITATGGYVDTGYLESFSLANNGDAGNGGDISITATGGYVDTGYLDSYSFVRVFSEESEAPEISATKNGGSIKIVSNSGDVTTENLDASSFAVNVVEITVEDENGEVVTELVSPTDPFGSLLAGSGGSIEIIASNGSITSQLTEVEIATSSGSINSEGVLDFDDGGGNVTLTAKDEISGFNVSTLSLNETSGDLTITGVGDLTLRNLTLGTSAASGENVPGTDIPIFQSNSSLDSRAGDTTISNLGNNLTLSNVLIDSSTSGDDDGGFIEIANAAIITLNDITIQSDTLGDGEGGLIEISNADTITLNNTTIESDTFGDATGDGGLIEISNADTITLNNTTIASDTFENATGDGGLIEISNADTITLNNTIITSDTFENATGDGGFIDLLNTSIVILNGSTIQTDADSDTKISAGDILVDDVDVLLFQNGSSLVARAEGNANGGNIEITDTSFIVAVPNDNNDLLATAEDGKGGQIRISRDSEAVLGFNRTNVSATDNLPGLQRNSTNDINALSDSGDDGSVEINNLDVDPSQGITELPADLTDRINQITAGCGIGNSDTQSEFVITGRGGLPPGPNDPATANQVNIPWVNYTEDTQTATIATPESSASTPLIEAQQIAIDPEGNAYFVPQGNHNNEDTLISSGIPSTEQCAATVLSQH